MGQTWSTSRSAVVFGNKDHTAKSSIQEAHIPVRYHLLYLSYVRENTASKTSRSAVLDALFAKMRLTNSWYIYRKSITKRRSFCGAHFISHSFIRQYSCVHEFLQGRSMYRPMRAVLSIIHVDTWCFTRCMVRLSKIPSKVPTPTPAPPAQIPFKSLSLLRRFFYLSQINSFLVPIPQKEGALLQVIPRVSDGVSCFLFDLPNSFALEYEGRAMGQKNGRRREFFSEWYL